MKMKTWLTIGIVAIVLVASLTAVGLLRVSGGDVAAQGQPVNVNVNSQQGIWVNGQGKVTLTPDIANINLGVSARADKVADAQAQAATAMDKLMATLTGNGIDKKDIQTTYFSIQPNYRYDQSTGQSTITGYIVSNTVSVKIRAIDKTGQIIDAVANAAGDNTVINGISFSIDKPEQYYAKARELAINDAKAKAQDLARLAGVTLGKATYVSESSSGPSIPYPMPATREMASGVAVPPTAISPGEQDVTLNVQVAFAIQ